MYLYPLQFEPILKERIWGGVKLKTLLHKPINSPITGESWEISAVEGDVSVVASGALKGKSLMDIINANPTEILGSAVYETFGKQFPLLFKYLDAREDLSVQVHPNDALAMRRHNSFGKTEMWYVMQADEDARLIVGFKKNSDTTEYVEHLNSKQLLSLLDTVKVKAGDTFFLETGTVHAVGAGVVIAEIQQTSDITYRLYDFDRKDAQGHKRELHVDLALDAINYKKVSARKLYQSIRNTSNEIVNCPYFTTNFIPLDGQLSRSKIVDSFTVLMCVAGNFSITYNAVTYQYKVGDTVLIPAVLNSYVLNGNASILEIYIS